MIKKIYIAKTDDEILNCYPVMKELRLHLSKEDFVDRVKKQYLSKYQLAYIKEKNKVLTIAGFRLSENLAWGKFLYVDDLVTHPNYRSQGLGSQLISWLKEYAKEENCSQVHLDSGLQRKEAHEFYKREKLSITGYHFAEVF